MNEELHDRQQEVFDRHAEFCKTLCDLPHPMRTKRGYGLLSKEGLLDPVDAFLADAKRRFRSVPFLEYRKSYFDPQQQATLDSIYMMCDDPRIFSIEPALGELLQNTTLRGAEYEHLRLPFRTCFFKLPPNQFEVWISHTDHLPLEGVYVSEERHEDSSWFLFLCVSTQPKERRFLDDCMFTMPILFVPGPLEEQVADRIEELRFGGHALTPNWKNVDQFPAVFRWMVNVILYVTSSEADVQNGWWHEKMALTMKHAHGGHKAKVRRQLELESARVSWVGRTIRINRMDKTSSDGGVEGDRKHPTLHWVHGFWRNQVYGQGRSLRRHIWVAPFLRGEGRDVVEKMYTVGPKEKECEKPISQE